MPGDGRAVGPSAHRRGDRGGTTAHGRALHRHGVHVRRFARRPVARSGPLPWSEVLDIGVLVAGALETAHRAGILHLDVKPANILMSRFAQAAVGDFRIPPLPRLHRAPDGRVRAAATYSAPERLMNGVATVATDL